MPAVKPTMPVVKPTMPTVKPYHEQILPAGQVPSYLERAGARARGRHGSGMAFTLPGSAWVLVLPATADTRRVQFFAGTCPC